MTTPDYLYRKAFFMADRNDVHVLIGSKHNKWFHNSNDDSWYAENFTQGGASEDRASFHYPNLERWLLRATQRYERGESKYNPFSGKNLAFVLHDKETEGTATVMVSPNVMEYARKIFRTDKDFVVEMFDWDLETLSSEQLMTIFNDIHRSFVTCSFSDTLGIATPTTLVAQVKTPALPVRGKTNKRRIKEGKNMKKNVVKINENTLRQIVAESVEKVLKEYEDRSFNSGEFYGEALDTAVQTYLDSLNIEPRYFATDTEKIGKAFGDKLFEIAYQNGNEHRNKLDAARINSTDYHGEGYGGYPY